MLLSGFEPETQWSEVQHATSGLLHLPIKSIKHAQEIYIYIYFGEEFSFSNNKVDCSIPAIFIQTIWNHTFYEVQNNLETHLIIDF